jgi:23S rRNA pseudouridine1911/1915/1917 synthase
MAKPTYIELLNGLIIPILYEDRTVFAIDKPAGWLVAPESWEQTGRNLVLALNSSMQAGDFWARSRNLKFLRHIHRLDAGTSGILLMVKSAGAVAPFSELFETRQVEKTYWAVVTGIPARDQWVCDAPIGQHPAAIGRVQVDHRTGKEAETHFKVLQRLSGTAMIEARPLTGRTHQIRLHLQVSGHPVLGDLIYGSGFHKGDPLALRAVRVAYRDPFLRRRVTITAPVEAFARQYGINLELISPGDKPPAKSSKKSPPAKTPKHRKK